MEISQSVFINDLCPEGNFEKFSDSLGVPTTTKMTLIHKVAKSAATEVQYFRIENSEHRGEVVEVTNTRKDGKPCAFARWLHSAPALVWLKYAVFDARHIDMNFSLASA